MCCKVLISRDTQGLFFFCFLLLLPFFLVCCCFFFAGLVCFVSAPVAAIMTCPPPPARTVKFFFYFVIFFLYFFSYLVFFFCVWRGGVFPLAGESGLTKGCQARLGKRVASRRAELRFQAPGLLFAGIVRDNVRVRLTGEVKDNRFRR